MDFVILAAGNSSRMFSSTPKIFQEIAGKPCVSYVLDLCRGYDCCAKIIVVTKESYSSNEIFSSSDVTLAIQKEPLGTADALKSAIPFIESEDVIVLYGDTPLVGSQDLNLFENDKHDVSLIAARLPMDKIDLPYGRIVGKKIVEYKDASAEERKINLINTGVYKFRASFLKKNIELIKENKNNGEYYLTDILDFADTDNIAIHTSDNYEHFHGINTMEDLAQAEKYMQAKLRSEFMQKGVKMLAPETVFLSADCRILGKDAVIEQNVVLKGSVTIHFGAQIKAFSYIEDSTIMENAKIGPFARIRGKTVVCADAEIGNFVEVKSSEIGNCSKAKHLAYIGDATLCEKVNIGAGTITCNYDGFNKHKTKIEENVMVGANTSLVAPITIGRGTIIAAGSVVTKNTPENSLTISRPKQENQENGATKFRTRKIKTL